VRVEGGRMIDCTVSDFRLVAADGKTTYTQLASDGVALDGFDISSLQAQLVNLGWLPAETYTDGMLDEATVAAIGAFQSYCNENFAMNLLPIDPLNPVVDAETMNALQFADATYANPNA
jgi:hypothetical protein